MVLRELGCQNKNPGGHWVRAQALDLLVQPLPYSDLIRDSCAVFLVCAVEISVDSGTGVGISTLSISSAVSPADPVRHPGWMCALRSRSQFTCAQGRLCALPHWVHRSLASVCCSTGTLPLANKHYEVALGLNFRNSGPIIREGFGELFFFKTRSSL